jgi:hypothetical protein
MPAPLAVGQTAEIDLKELEAAYGAVLNATQKQLKALIARRHPGYAKSLPHWEFLESTYQGGREWFEKNVFKYVKEGDKEFSDRVQRAYRFNHTREVVDLINKYLFKQDITRNVADAPASVKAFWEKAAGNSLEITDYAKQISKKTSTYGRIAIVVDNHAVEAPLTKADEKAAGAQPYAYMVGPEQLLDYAFDDDGELVWALIYEIARDDGNPMTSSGVEEPQYRLWERYGWRLFKEEVVNRVKKVIEIGQGFTGLGEVPVILADHVISDERWCAPAMIDDIAYLDRACANYLSNLDAIIQDQTFSQLAMPAQNVLPGEDTYTKLLEMGTKRVFLYDGEGGTKPEYLSPDVKQAELIITAVNKIINEIYHTVGLAGERTKQDNALGIDNSSGVAKAYDFERVNALLAAKADSLENIENRIARLVALWAGEEAQITKDLVSYPDNFDTRGLYDEFDLAARLQLVMAPDSVRRQQMTQMLDKLFPQLAQGLKDKMLAELKDWPPKLDPLTGLPPDQAALQKLADRGTAQEALDTAGTPGQGSNK